MKPHHKSSTCRHRGYRVRAVERRGQNVGSHGRAQGRQDGDDPPPGARQEHGEERHQRVGHGVERDRQVVGRVACRWQGEMNLVRSIASSEAFAIH